MKRFYNVTIIETLQKEVTVKACSTDEAVEIAEELYYRGEDDFVLSSENLTGFDISADQKSSINIGEKIYKNGGISYEYKK